MQSFLYLRHSAVDPIYWRLFQFISMIACIINRKNRKMNIDNKNYSESSHVDQIQKIYKKKLQINDKKNNTTIIIPVPQISVLLQQQLKHLLHDTFYCTICMPCLLFSKHSDQYKVFFVYSSPYSLYIGQTFDSSLLQ